MHIAAITSLIIILIICVGGVLLQIFLSKKENKILGLILPLITFLFSLLSIFSVAVMDSMSAWDVFSMIAGSFIVTNIPTIILLAIYFACKEKIRRKKQLDKMNIQDLN
ncbi:MAG: hypothetical protein RR232_08500 [Clostridia bacterium]